MLDLREKSTELYQLTDVEGRIINIKLPNQKQLKLLQRTLSETIPVDEIFGIFMGILNNNVEGIEYPDEYAEQFDLMVVTMVIKDYFEFVGACLGE